MTVDQFAQAMQVALISGMEKAVGTMVQIGAAEIRAHPIVVIVCVAAIVVAKGVGRGRRRT